MCIYIVPGMLLISPDNWIHCWFVTVQFHIQSIQLDLCFYTSPTFHLVQHSPSNHSPPHHHLISSETAWYSPKNSANPSENFPRTYITYIYTTYVNIFTSYIHNIHNILYIYTYPSKIGKNGSPGFIFRPWLCCTSLGRRFWPYIPFEIHSNWATGFFFGEQEGNQLGCPRKWMDQWLVYG